MPLSQIVVLSTSISPGLMVRHLRSSFKSKSPSRKNCQCSNSPEDEAVLRRIFFRVAVCVWPQRAYPMEPQDNEPKKGNPGASARVSPNPFLEMQKREPQYAGGKAVIVYQN